MNDKAAWAVFSEEFNIIHDDWWELYAGRREQIGFHATSLSHIARRDHIGLFCALRTPEIRVAAGKRRNRVRREKVVVHSGIDPPGSWFVPPSSNQSSGGGNETAEASGAEGRKGG